MTVFTAEHHKNGVRHLVFSSDESTFASISSNIMCVCDSETGHCISGPFQLHYDEYDACFSPGGRRILLKFDYYAVVLDIEMGEERFRIEGLDFVFIQDGRRIASTDGIDQDKGGVRTGVVVKLWDASSGSLISNRLLEVNDVACTKFSPDGHFLAVARESESVIELWSVEDGKDPQRFSYPPGDLESLDFSPTSDSLMAVSPGNAIYVWRLDTQEMASFDHDFNYFTRVIHSTLTNYLFIGQGYTVKIWDVSMTGSKPIWETNPRTTSQIWSICPSRDGHRILIGCGDGSVRMWELDLKNLAMNQTDTIDTQADVDMPKFIAFSHSGKMVATRSKRSHIELLDTTTGEVVSRTDIDKQDYNGIEIAFSPDENQVAFLSRSRITICDTVQPNNRVSFNPWPSKDVWFWEVAFQTSNDLFICAISHDYSALLQVWHRQDPAGFECTYSLDIKIEKHWYPFLEPTYPLPAPDGLTIVIVPVYSSAKCYSWNHDTAQFHLIDFVDNPVDIYAPKYSPDGRLFACWSRDDSHVRVWDTRTGRLVSKFRTSRVDAMALSPTLIEHSPSDRLIALNHDSGIGLYDAYTGHMYAKILGRGMADMAFIRDGTKLAYYSSDFGLRIWDIVDLTDERWHSIHGSEFMPFDMTDGWVMGRDNEPLFWVPVEHRDNLYVQSSSVIPRKKTTRVDLSNSRLGRKWMECIDNEWLRQVERKGKEMGNVLEKYVLSSAQVFGDVEMDR